MIGIEFDTSEVNKNLVAMAERVPGLIPDVLFEAGGFILEKSGEQVPLDEGTLQDSGKVDPQDDGSVIVGYHTPYAARLHEHPEYHFQRGRKGKYLSDPIAENAKMILQVIGTKLKQGLGI